MVGKKLRLEVENLSFSYTPDRAVFKDVSFSVESGEILCILGPNGVGKTTLLKSIGGLLKPDSGNISLNGRDIRSLSRMELAREIGYVPQSHVPAFSFSVLDMVLMGRAPHLGLFSSPGASDISIALRALETVGAAHLADRAYAEISGGERQLVLLARVLAQESSILLLDEPTSHLDFGNQVRVLDVINKLARMGKIIIMTSHCPDHAFLISSKVAIMHEGKLMALGTPEDIITQEKLKKGL